MTYTPNLDELVKGEPVDDLPPLPRLLDGSWFLDVPEDEQPLWGDGPSVLWSSGEPLYIVGPPGAGKSTLAQQLVLRRIGLLADDLLGYPVTTDDRPVLYVAADRSRQIRKSVHRMVTEADRDLLMRSLLPHEGPLPFALADDPQLLTRYAEHYGIGTVVLDSAKDMGGDLAEGADAAAFNMALQHLVAAGVEVLVLHHDRKGGDADLDDVYGSRWLTAGAGSVLTMRGHPAEGPVTLRHVKQPNEPVGPLKLEVDRDTGAVRLHDRGDPVAILASAPQGMAATDLARHLDAVAQPSRAQVERARRLLERLVSKGLATRQDSLDRNTPTLYRATP